MRLTRFVRTAAVALTLGALVLTAGCDTANKELDALVGKTSTPIPEYPAVVNGPGTPMSKAGCEKYQGKDAPLECQKAPKGMAFLSVSTADGIYGPQEYVAADQLKATCTKKTITVKGADGISVVFLKGARKVTVLRGEEIVGTYPDQYLSWVRRDVVQTDGTSKLGDGSISISMRVTCQPPAETRTPEPVKTLSPSPTAPPA